MRLLLLLGAIFAVFSSLESAKILGVFHIAAYSHYQLGDIIFKELAARGHEVTVISPYAEKKEVKNFKQVILDGFIEELEERKKDLFTRGNDNPIKSLFWLHEFGMYNANKTFYHPNVQKLLRSNARFDLVIVEQFLNEAHKGFCYHYGAPCVVLDPMAISSTSAQVGNPISPAYVPASILNYGSKMNFIQRAYNTYLYVVSELFFHLVVIPRENEVLQKHFPGAPHIYDIYYNTSLMLHNGHVSVNAAGPRVPNMIDIGGYHVKAPKALPSNLQEFLDSAKEGVIYFSMGSNLKSRSMSLENRNAILKAFSKLKQKVLWKWEDENLPNQPPNVKISKWLPQQDILAHPNIKLFISHGGLLSTTESVYHGVPILALPVFGDQDGNAATAELAGYAVKLSYHEFTEESFNWALNEIINNPKYAENAKLRAKIMHDQPMKPLERAMFWIEYVLRHKGAPHLRSAALHLTWYQYLLLDVAAFCIAIVAILFYLLWKLIRTLCCYRKVQKVDKKKKKS